MPATIPRQFRLNEAEIARLDELGRFWGPVTPLTRTQVLRELIRYAPDQHPAPKKKLSKKSAVAS